MYIILNHYSNENTNEFDIITVQEMYTLWYR